MYYEYGLHRKRYRIYYCFYFYFFAIYSISFCAIITCLYSCVFQCWEQSVRKYFAVMFTCYTVFIKKDVAGISTARDPGLHYQCYEEGLAETGRSEEEEGKTQQTDSDNKEQYTVENDSNSRHMA